MCASVNLCQSSGFGGPGTFVVVFLHMFIKLLQLFGDDDLTNPERVSERERAKERRTGVRPFFPLRPHGGVTNRLLVFFVSVSAASVFRALVCTLGLSPLFVPRSGVAAAAAVSIPFVGTGPRL